MHTQIRPHSTPHRPSLPSPSSSSIPERAALSFPSSFPLFPGPITISSLNMTLNAAPVNTQMGKMGVDEENLDLDGFSTAAGRVADAAGEVIRRYFRKKFEILDKDDLSPVTIADRAAEEAMVSIILENFPSHAIYGEENGWRCREKYVDFVWVLDPIDGTKSFITGKPLFGTLIALLYKGRPILGIIDQPILRERWLGIFGRKTTLNGEELSTRACAKLAQAYLYTTSPHLFSGDAEEAFSRIRNKVKMPLYGCDCYAYALLASGYVDLVVESGLKQNKLNKYDSWASAQNSCCPYFGDNLPRYEEGKKILGVLGFSPYDFLALIPVIEGAGGVITDWKGNKLEWKAVPDSIATSFNVVAAGDRLIHEQALNSLQWP